LIEKSDIADDLDAILQEIRQRLFQITGEAPPKMSIKWRVLEHSIFGTDTVIAPGYYIVGDLQAEDHIEWAIGKLKWDLSFPLTGQMIFIKARVCSKNNDSHVTVHQSLRSQQKFAKTRVYFSIIGLDPEVLNRIPKEPAGVGSIPNRQSVKDLLLNLRSIEKIGKGDSLN
jgi:hypothetical protein